MAECDRPFIEVSLRGNSLGPNDARDGELKVRAMRCCRRSPEASAVRLNYASADRQPHAHAVDFGREQRVEDAMADRFIDPRARIFDSDPDTTVVVELRANRE